MATIEYNTRIQRLDDSGNTEIHYPITKTRNILGFENIDVDATMNDISAIKNSIDTTGIRNSGKSGRNISTARIDCTMTAFDGKLYVVGGYNDTGSLATMERYTPTTNTWSTGPSMNNKRRGHTATLFDGKLYIVGGWASSIGTVASVEIYDFASNKWTVGASMAVGRAHHKSVLFREKIYVIGGIISGSEDVTNRPTSSSGISPVVEIYDIRTNTWSRGVDMSFPRVDHTATLYGDNVYVMGGTSTEYNIPDEVYNIQSNTWSYMPKPARESVGVWSHVPGIGVSSHTATLVQNRIYVIGGFRISAHPTDVIIYDISTNTWSIGGSIEDFATYGMGRHNSILAEDGMIYVTGGYRTGIGGGVGTTYDPLTDTISRTSSIFDGHDRCVAAIVDNKIYVVGGTYSSSGTTYYYSSLRIFDPGSQRIFPAIHTLHRRAMSSYGHHLPPILTGSYIGNGSTSGRMVGIGNSDDARVLVSSVLICQMGTYTLSQQPFVGTLLVVGKITYGKTSSGGEALPIGEIVPGGFIVYGNGPMTNSSGVTYKYIVYR